MSVSEQQRRIVLAQAKVEHDKICHCDPKYIMSCHLMPNLILEAGVKLRMSR